MNKLKRILSECISKYAQKKGIEIKIDNISFLQGFIFKNICVQWYNEEVMIQSLCIKISIKDLLQNRYVARAIGNGITIASKHIAKADFNVETVECKASFDKHLKEIASDIILNQEIKLSFRSIRNPGNREFFLKAIDLSIDKYKNLFEEHILSHFMKKIYSNSQMTILCYYKLDKTTPFPIVNSKFQYDSLIIYPDNDVISKQYLLNELYKCNHLAKKYLLFEEIPEIIRRTVICTEDPSFELHKGISPVLLGMTLRANISQQALGPGGSTISMQLIKNALLNGEKTMCRKMEEAILTLLMENYYHVSKQDILEVYLNMIEFAPNLYGIEDAARFYFDKSSTELNIIEVIVLTYIIPRPIHFYEALLQKAEQLRRNLRNHIKQYLGVALQKKIVTQSNIQSIETKQIKFGKEFGVLTIESWI
jgi:hypothetical protein